MINKIWFLLIIIGTMVATMGGKSALITESIFSNSKKAIEFTIGLAGIIAFWSGILKIAETAGITKGIAKIFQPFLSKLFPRIPGNHPVFGLISLTVAANMLGLGNVSTPIGLKAIAELQKINPDKKKISPEICTFLTLVLGAFSILPTTLIAIRSEAGSPHPGLIIGPIIIVTFMGTLIALLANYMLTLIFSFIDKKKQLKILNQVAAKSNLDSTETLISETNSLKKTTAKKE